MHIRSYRVVAVGDIEFELIAVDTGSAEGVDIFHHQIPCAASSPARCVRTRFQHFQRQCIRCTQLFAAVRRELTHLIDLTVVRIFVGHSQHLVLVERRFERYITQRSVQRIFATGKQTGRFHFLEIAATFHSVQSFECRAGLLQVAERGLAYGLIERVRFVVRRQAAGSAPCIYLHVLAILAQVGERNDITRLVVGAAFVGYPYLDLVDCYAAGYIRHTCHRLLVAVAEEMAEEEMAVLVVGIARYIEFSHLGTAFTAHRLRLAILLADKGLYFEFTEF